MNRVKTKSPSAQESAAGAARDKKPSAGQPARSGTRETIESIVVAIILAFLFRAFEAEAFVIPTGSMAPTLQGRHIDVQCEQCGYWYRTGASCENKDSETPGLVTKSTCPICRYPMTLKRRDNPYYNGPHNANHQSFTGDRILVNKFAYQLGQPHRWDVIVFKYPGNAKQNYIKRLVGLPNETIMIRHGDVYIKLQDAQRFQIARKPPHKVRAMLQLVDDTNHIAKDLRAVGWPSRWQQWSREGQDRSWQIRYEGPRERFWNEGTAPTVQWLRYRHLVPRWGPDPQDPRREIPDWQWIEQGKLPADLDRRKGQLISDYYAYNDTIPYPEPYEPGYALLRRFKAKQGMHWVGDLAVECDVQVKGQGGQLLLDLVEAGVHYTCRLEVRSGKAELSIDNGQGRFSGDRAAVRTAQTKLRGPGTYHLRFANVDDELLLWVNDQVVAFDRPARYQPAENPTPLWSETDPGDAEPIGIGSRGAALEITGLRVLRDVYYVATKDSHFRDFSDYGGNFDPVAVRDVLNHPEQWKDNRLFLSRRSFTFTLSDDQFFPMGDNSPQSSDARYWEAKGIEPYVRRDLLTGKALFIYWPHAWNRPIPYLPNFKRMRFIR